MLGFLKWPQEVFLLEPPNRVWAQKARFFRLYGNEKPIIPFSSRWRVERAGVRVILCFFNPRTVTLNLEPTQPAKNIGSPGIRRENFLYFKAIETVAHSFWRAGPGNHQPGGTGVSPVSPQALSHLFSTAGASCPSLPAVGTPFMAPSRV